MQEYPDWIMWESALSDEVCDEIIEKCKELDAQAASTFRSGEGNADQNRLTQIRWIPKDDEHNWINGIFEEYAKRANEYFDLEISYLPELQFTEYKDIGYHYGWHHDIDWGNQTGTHRKISLVLQLTDPDDYSGGEFAFKHIESPDIDALKKRGTIIAFRSYHIHCVQPILGGARTSVVGWYRGPRWQ